MNATKLDNATEPSSVDQQQAYSANRYKVVDGSQSCHCCFSGTVVDTTKPVMIRGQHYRSQYETVCECFDAADAKAICDALNAAGLTAWQPSKRRVHELCAKINSGEISLQNACGLPNSLVAYQ